jgi:hypothetical protein
MKTEYNDRENNRERVGHNILEMVSALDHMSPGFLLYDEKYTTVFEAISSWVLFYL